MNTIPQPSIKSLLWSCFFSILLAIIILLVAVLPAEYNIDPTGLGKTFGLTVLADSKEAVITCPELVNTNNISGVKSKSQDKQTQSIKWKDTVVITVPARKGLEYKFHLSKGEKLEFAWNTKGASLYFDFHGEPQGDTTGYFKSFKESTQSKSSGTLTAPFTGSHGWYWENKTNQAVSITLKTHGNYKILGLR